MDIPFTYSAICSGSRGPNAQYPRGSKNDLPRRYPFAESPNVLLSEFHKPSELRDASPRRVQKFTRKRAQNQVHTLPTSLAHDFSIEGIIPGVE